MKDRALFFAHAADTKTAILSTFGKMMISNKILKDPVTMTKDLYIYIAYTFSS